MCNYSVAQKYGGSLGIIVLEALSIKKSFFWLLLKNHNIDGFHVTSSPPCWCTKTKDVSLASFLFVHQKSYISLLSLVSLEIG